MMKFSRNPRVGLVLFVLALLSSTPKAMAVASFARQTGLPCQTCHYTFPELTPFGRLFKLNGYTLTGMQTITAKSSRSKAGLDILNYLPLSAFFLVSDTVNNVPQPQAQNGNVEFPQQISLFLAGAIASHAGTFSQITYDPQGDHFTMDNTDFRYANTTKVGGKDMIYGITLNNNPGVEDIWNDTPAWRFPFIAPDSGVGPLAGAIIDGSLAQDVAGLGGYMMYDNHFYADFTAYRSMHIGSTQPPTGVGSAYNIKGAAPYWRLAWQQSMGNNYLEVGTYGMYVNTSPNAFQGPTDTYTDVAVDSQYERVLPTFHNDVITVHTSYTHEHSDLNASYLLGAAGLVAHHLDTFRIDGNYHFGNKYTLTGAYFNTTGTADPTLFASAPVTGSLNGNPKTDGFIGQFAYWPVQNIELTAQYTAYLTFNGAAGNYDGAGRNAASNNTTYVAVWFNW